MVNRSPRDLVDATSSHQIGTRKYTVKTTMMSIATPRETELSCDPGGRRLGAA